MSQIERVQSLAGALRESVEGHGGFLRCKVCQQRKPVKNAGHYLSDGWPRCCDYTMRWWTRRQIDAGEVPSSRSYPT